MTTEKTSADVSDFVAAANTLLVGTPYRVDPARRGNVDIFHDGEIAARMTPRRAEAYLAEKTGRVFS